MYPSYFAACSGPTTTITSAMPATTASSSAYSISGLPFTGMRFLGVVSVSGRRRRPRPATGRTSLVTFISLYLSYNPSLVAIQRPTFLKPTGIPNLLFLPVPSTPDHPLPIPDSELPGVRRQDRRRKDHERGEIAQDTPTSELRRQMVQEHLREHRREEEKKRGLIKRVQRQEKHRPGPLPDEKPGQAENDRLMAGRPFLREGRVTGGVPEEQGGGGGRGTREQKNGGPAGIGEMEEQVQISQEQEQEQSRLVGGHAIHEGKVLDAEYEEKERGEERGRPEIGREYTGEDHREREGQDQPQGLENRQEVEDKGRKEEQPERQEEPGCPEDPRPKQ